jgi:hypothetical protein
MTPEGKIEDYLKRRVLETGGRLRKLSWIGRNGAPDRLVWWPGPIMSFVELKAPGKKPSAIQVREHERLRVDGFHVFLLDSFEGVEAFVQCKGRP